MTTKTTYSVMMSTVMSSTNLGELSYYQRAVQEVMTGPGLQESWTEYDVSVPDRDVIVASSAKVDEADAYVGFIGDHYGQVPKDQILNPYELSLTELEFRRAALRGIPICMFITHDDHLIQRRALDDHHDEQKLQMFLEFAKQMSTHVEFESIDDLKAKAIVALSLLRNVLDIRALRAAFGTATTGETQDASPPSVPQPGPGPRLIVQEERLDVELHRAKDQPEPSRRSKALLNELREAARDFANAFDLRTNVHSQLRQILDRYRAQVDLVDPDIDVIFALGLRLENAEAAARRQIANRFEPELEDSQHEALSSVLRIHAVFILSEPEGAELIEAAERYAHRPQDDERFKARAQQVAGDMAQAQNLATDRLIELLEGILEEMNRGEHPARTGTIGRNTIQRALITLAKAAIGGVAGATAGQIFIQSGVGHVAIADGVLFVNKSIEFFLNHADDLRALAAVSEEGFGFLNALIDWLTAKLER